MKEKAAWPGPLSGIMAESTTRPAPSMTATGMDDLARAAFLCPADGLIGANDLHPAPRAGVDDQAKSVQFHDGRNQVESEANAWRAANLVRAIEPAQHGLTFLIADSRTRIHHTQDGLSPAGQQLELDAAAPGRELDGVVDEVGNRLQQQVSIAAHGKCA